MSKPKNRKIAGVIVTPEQLKTAQDNGISYGTLQGRLYRKFTVEEAIQPLMQKQSKGKEKFDVAEIKRIVGRIKYLNQFEKDFPYPIPKRTVKLMQQKGIRLEDIEPVEVLEIEEG